MTIWILAAVLIGGLGALGRQIGGIRMGISLLGAIIAYVSTLYLTGIVSNQLLPTIGMRNPVYIWVLSPLVVFFGVFIFINGIAQGVFLKIKVYFDYRAKEDARMRFTRMDTNVGLACGMMAGVVHLLIIMVPIYVLGYVTLQFDSPNGNPFYVNFISKARADMDGSGWDRIAASMAPETDDLNQFADTAGLIYNNKSVQDFLGEYPLFYAMAENDTIMPIFTGEGADQQDNPMNAYSDEDEEPAVPYHTLVREQGNIKAIIDHPQTMELLNNPDFMDRVNELDYADLKTFIDTGESPKYAEEPIVGKWRIDTARTARETARRHAQARLSSIALQNMKIVLNNTATGITLIVSPEGSAFLKSANNAVVKFTPFMRQRMTGAEVATFAVGKRPANRTLAVGSWSGDGDGLKVDLTASGTGNAYLISGVKTAQTKLSGGFLMFDYGEYRMVFYKHL